MKIAVLADVHANFVALQRVTEHIETWRPDQVIMAGDLVNRGPRPVECLEFVQEKQRTQGWRLVRGNHEDYVIHMSKLAQHSGPAFEVHRASYWTYQRLGCNVSALEAMPFQQSLHGPDGAEVRIVHASMRGMRDGIYPETSDNELALKIGLEPQINRHDGASRQEAPALICVGHTHRSLVRRLDGVLVVNAGSAGLPFDGDTRPAYAQLTWEARRWEARIVRLEYDLAQAEHDFFESGYVQEAGPLVHLVLIELRTARSQLYSWSVRYQAQAMAGQISMQESVLQYLARG